MGQKKLIRFEAIKAFSNVLEEPTNMAGNWQQHFNHHHPITLELACGKGEYTVALAQRYPQHNFIGIDIKGNRLYIGAKQCLEKNIRNAAFLRIQIDKITDFFEAQEVQTIWLTFPDPQLRTSKAKKRLTHPKYLRLYQKILVPGGCIHLKTDSPQLYAFTKLVIEMYGIDLLVDSDNVYAQPNLLPDLNITTHYETLDIAKSNRIHYLQFRLPDSPLPQLDDGLHQQIKENENIVERGS
jgi:tRNA (guanine-N7-)-methyltransferase